jgi:hypothetical protein
VDYHHVVFTLPAEVNPIGLLNPVAVYDALLGAAARTIREVAADPKHLGAEVGLLLVLHTWGQTLSYHPHAHGIATGGGLTPEGRWRSCRPGFFLPVRVLGAVFRGKFVSLLRAAFDRGELSFQGALQHVGARHAFAAWLDRAMAQAWVVYSKPPFGGPLQVLKYLARYTHRVAIGNRRIVGIDAEGVTFRWRDRANGDRPRTMKLSGVEFLRRFLLHVLPRGFQRIRHYGLLGNRARAVKLAVSRLALDAEMPETSTAATSPAVSSCDLCPSCGSGRMLRHPIAAAREVEVCDSS